MELPRFLPFAILTLAALARPAFARDFVHPGMLHTAADLERMTSQVNAGAEPWKSGWDVLVANFHASPMYAMQGPVPVVYRGTGSPENYGKIYNDIAAAYANALRWRISGNTACAERAVAVLNAWSSILTRIDGSSDRFLAAGLYGYQFANAAELMRGYPGWSAAEFGRFQQMMLNVFYPANHDFLVRHNGACISHYWANWDLCNLASILAIGILCDDTAKFDEAITYFKTGAGNGAIAQCIPFFHPGGLAQCQESGRDQGHTGLDVALLGVICQMAYNQGEDLFGYQNNRVLAMCEYVAQYNLGNPVPYTPYNNCDNVNQTVISAASRGDRRPAWELIYNHYARRLGVAAPQSQAYAALVRPEGGGGNYGPNSGGFDQLGYGTLTYTLDRRDLAGRITNLSIRSRAGTGGETLTVGFVVAGAPASVLVRAAGPALRQYGVSDALSQTQLDLYATASGARLGRNTRWEDDSGGASIAAASRSVGAFAFAPGSADTALVSSMSEGSYSAQVTGGGNARGIALVELYDTNPAGLGRLTNVSARTMVGSGENTLIAGFVVSGTEPRTLLVRAIGPSLTNYGVADALPDPTLKITNVTTGATVTQNVNWSTGSPTQVRVAATKAGAFPISTNSADSAVVVSLPPGAYSAMVGSASDKTGVGLVEVYEIP